MEFKIIAKTFQGLEEVLAKELTELGANNIEIGNRMVTFTGDQEMLYRANFCLRTAVKILKPIKEFKATNADEVYEVVKQMEWEQWMSEKETFLVESVVNSESFRHSKFVAYRVKDAIADHFREQNGERPNVSLSNPDFRIHVHIAEHDVSISLDSSGESLHKRGYRVATVKAPLNEVLAAGMIMLTGWKGDTDLIDPFCGSGTILIEAALIAKNIYPGIFREEFAFERWRDFNPALLESIYNDDSHERTFDHKIYGFDINRQVVAIAQENVRAAGLTKIISVEQKDFNQFEWPCTPVEPANNEAVDMAESTGSTEDTEVQTIVPETVQAPPAVIITNPPYGERLQNDDILQLYATIGQRLKHTFVGNDAWIMSYHFECFDQIGFRASTRIALYNGALPCEFRRYQVFSGKLKQRRSEGLDIKTAEERRRNAEFKPHRPFGAFEQDKKDAKDEKPKRAPLFEGDGEPELNRYNFKWGDRSINYGQDERNGKSHNKFGAGYGQRQRDDRPRRDDRQGFRRRDTDRDFRKEKGFRKDKNFRGKYRNNT